MANFPTSVFNPPNRSAGQTIDASHVNDLQAEVTAIEDGYRNATAPLNSSNSTVANLSVAGDSTFAGDVAVSGTLTVGGLAIGSAPPDAVRLEIGSSLTVSAGVNSTVTWGTQAYITNSSLHAVGANGARVFPQSTGIYYAHAQITFTQNSSGLRQVRIEDSSGAIVAYTRVPASTDNPTTIHVSGTKRFDVVGGHFVVAVNQLNASTLSVTAADTWFDVRKL